MKGENIVCVKVRLILLNGSCKGSAMGGKNYIMRQGFQELYKH